MLNRLADLHHLVRLPHTIQANRTWRPSFQPRRHAGPSAGYLLLAGLAVVAFVKLMSVANRPKRSRAEVVVLGALLLALGAIVASFRRSARRYRR